MSLRSDALTIFRAALRAADAGDAVRAAWPRALRTLGHANFDRIFLLAIGKAAGPMAAAMRKQLGRAFHGGVVVTKYGHARGAAEGCELMEAAHPIPDESGLAASHRVETLLRQLNARDLLIVAISGGASALLAAPALGITLAQKQATTQLLLRAGVTIHELNAVRKHLSRLKGGKLAALAYPATLLNLVLSDVVGDPLDVIASGPTVPDPTTFADALAVLHRYSLLKRVPAAVRRHLEAAREETPKPNDVIFQNVHSLVIASNRLALEAASVTARKLGYRTLTLASSFEGEARELGRMHATIARNVVENGQPLHAPACILSGGEPTVTVRGAGRGGRAQEFALAAALTLSGVPNCVIASIGTDGTDGPTDAAGALVSGDTIRTGRTAGRDARDYLARNDSYSFFEGTKALIKTGPTGTNVMDFNLILVRSERRN